MTIVYSAALGKYNKKDWKDIVEAGFQVVCFARLNDTPDGNEVVQERIWAHTSDILHIRRPQLWMLRGPQGPDGDIPPRFVVHPMFIGDPGREVPRVKSAFNLCRDLDFSEGQKWRASYFRICPTRRRVPIVPVELELEHEDIAPVLFWPKPKRRKRPRRRAPARGRGRGDAGEGWGDLDDDAEDGDDDDHSGGLGRGRRGRGAGDGRARGSGARGRGRGRSDDARGRGRGRIGARGRGRSGGSGGGSSDDLFEPLESKTDSEEQGFSDKAVELVDSEESDSNDTDVNDSTAGAASGDDSDELFAKSADSEVQSEVGRVG